MRRKGRGSPPPRHQGEEIAAGRLTTGQVLEIRRRYYSEDVSGWELARQYGVASNAVWMILRRKTWAHLPFVEGETGEMIQKPKPWLLGSNNPDARLTEEQVHAIRYRYAAEILTIPELSREYGVAYSVIGAILRRQTWAHLPILPGEATCCRTTQETITLRGRRPQPPEANAARAEAMRRHWAALSQEERAARGAPRKTSRGQKREPA